MALLLSGAVALSSPLHAAPVLVPVVNPGFESPVVSLGSNWSSPVTGWNNSSPAAGIRRTTAGLPSASEGSQYAWFTNSSPAAILDLTQYPATIDGSARYDLFVDVCPLQAPSNCFAWIKLGDLTAGRFMAEKLFRPPWNTNLTQFQLTNGAWTTVKVTFHGDDFPGINGHTLVLNLQGRQVAMDNVRLYKTVISNAAAATYYISASAGSDANNGLSPASAWRSFTNVAERRFVAGSTILLNRGDVWSEELNLRGSGAAGLTNQVGAYGSGSRPVIIRVDKLFDVGVVLNNANHWRVADLETRGGSVGLFVRNFEISGTTNVTVENCRFTGMDSWVLDPALHNLERSWSGGIWIGGMVKNSDTNTTQLNGLTIRNCIIEDAASGIGTGWYYPPPYRARIANVLVEDTYAVRCMSGGLSLNCVSNAVVRRFRSFGTHQLTGAFSYGTTAGFVNSCADLLIEDSEFSDTRRFWPDQTQGDGSGFDIDGNNLRVTMRRCVFHNNDAQGLFTLSTYGVANSNTLIANCTFWNNALNASDDTYAPGGNAYELKFTEFTMATSTATNLGLYRGASATSWVYKPASALVTTNNLRSLWWSNYVARPQQPAWDWNADNNFEGWTNRNAWLNPAVSGGVLSGTAQNNDPFVYSPPLWVNTHRNSRYLRVRMKTTAGSIGAIYFITEHDATWDGNKVAGFSLIADNQYHDYLVDLRASAGYGGVVTQIRLDPTDVSGAQFAVDSVIWQPDVGAGNLQLVTLGASGAGLRFATEPGLTVRLQGSTNLAAWFDVQVQTTDPAGVADFVDPEALPGAPQRYYRVSWP
jgi:hypothetical protein